MWWPVWCLSPRLCSIWFVCSSPEKANDSCCHKYPRVSVAYIRGSFFHWHYNRIQADLGDAIFHITSKGLRPPPCCMSTIFSFCSVAKLCPALCDPMNCSRLPCPSLSPGVCSDSCPLCLWCHPAISSSFTPFSSSPQSFPALGSFPMNWLLRQVAKVLELEHQSFQWIFRVDFL